MNTFISINHKKKKKSLPNYDKQNYFYYQLTTKNKLPEYSVVM